MRARRDFLESDVDHLERHLSEERSRLREAATTLLDLTERVPGGLGEVRRPLLSASDDETPTGTDIPPLPDDDLGDRIDSADVAQVGDEGDEHVASRVDAGDDHADDDGLDLTDAVDRTDDDDDSDGLFIRADIADDEFGEDTQRT